MFYALLWCFSLSSGLTAISTYFLTKELWSPGAGLFAASFIAIVPGYISRSVAGSYDNEGIAIFALQFTYYLWVKSVKTGSVFWAAMAALSYFYMVSAWGGYVFIINLIPLHVFVLLLMGRYSPRLFTSYTTFYILGLLFSMQIPFVGFQPIRTSEHMAASGVFALILAVAVLKHMQTVLSKQEFKKLFIIGGLAAAGLVFGAVVLLTLCGVSCTYIQSHPHSLQQFYMNSISSIRLLHHGVADSTHFGIQAMQKSIFRLLLQCLNINRQRGSRFSSICTFWCARSQWAFGTQLNVSTMNVCLSFYMRSVQSILPASWFVWCSHLHRLSASWVALHFLVYLMYSYVKIIYPKSHKRRRLKNHQRKRNNFTIGYVVSYKRLIYSRLTFSIFLSGWKIETPPKTWNSPRFKWWNWFEFEEHCCCCNSHVANDVCCALHLGHQQCLLKPVNCASILQWKRWVRITHIYSNWNSKIIRFIKWFFVTEHGIFWMISVKHTTGYHKIQLMMHGWCLGGIMGIR